MEDMSKVCDRFQQFCANSVRPLLFSGGLFTLISAGALGYVAYTSNEIYRHIDPEITANKYSLSYYLQLAAAVYLLLVALLVYLAGYYDQKHAIRVVSHCTALHCRWRPTTRMEPLC